jgi:hypothetical protein
VGRVQLFLTSLVAAVPSAFLTYLVAMMIVNQSENLSTTLMGVLGVTAACGVVATIGLPVMSLMPSRGKSAKSPTKGGDSVAEVEAAEDEDFGELDAIEVAEDDELGATAAFEASDSDAGVFDDSGDLSDASLSDTDLADSGSDLLDAFDDEEEEAPKKKKKR